MGINEKELVKWDTEDQQLIIRCVDQLLSILNIDGGKVKTIETFKLDIYLKILSQKVSLKDVTSLETKRNLLYRTFFTRLKFYKQQEIYYFRRALATELHNHLSQPIIDYWILLPLHVPKDQIGNARSITVLNTKLLFRDWIYVSKRFELDKYFKDTRNHIKDRRFNFKSNFTPVLVKNKWRGYLEAFTIAVQHFDLLRYLINLNYQFGLYTHISGSTPKPLGLILPPPTFGIFYESGKYKEFLFTIGNYEDYKRNKLAPQVMKDVRKLALRLQGNTDKNQTRSILIESIEKYGEALDTNQWRHAFLLLWQILELITLQSSEKSNMTVVKNRVINLLKQDPMIRDLLDALYETRNLLVHQGAFPISQGFREVNLLKIITERSINKLYGLIRICPTTASLERYYQYISFGKSELADRGRIIKYIHSSK